MNISPEEPNENDSNENVEKVVNPPQNPTINKAFNLSFINPFLLNIPQIKPKRRHPKTFIVKVAKGKEDFHVKRNRRLTRKRQQVPIKPPIPAKSISLIIPKRNYHFLFNAKLQKKAD